MSSGFIFKLYLSGNILHHLNFSEMDDVSQTKCHKVMRLKSFKCSWGRCHINHIIWTNVNIFIGLLTFQRC